MPILEVEIVMKPGEGARENLAQEIAECAARVFGSPSGRTWVRLHQLSRDDYAEDGDGPPEDVLPVFVNVLKAELPPSGEMKAEVHRLTEAIADVTNRPAENVHIKYEQPAAGRMAFGGRIV